MKIILTLLYLLDVYCPYCIYTSFFSFIVMKCFILLGKANIITKVLVLAHVMQLPKFQTAILMCESNNTVLHFGYKNQYGFINPDLRCVELT